MDVCIPGSSPHTRGTRAQGAINGPNGRFIPACAGNAETPRTWTTSSTVYPRMRGERTACSAPGLSSHGSSPHTRGTRHYRGAHATTPRFIPAYAGNARSTAGRDSQSTVHPRIRGERATPCVNPMFSHGSSPHARGTPRDCGPTGAAPRFIPACAGNAPRVSRRSRVSAVHPRMRGERNFVHTVTETKPGSSPHARGTRAGTGGAG